MLNVTQLIGDRSEVRRVCLAPHCCNIFTVGEGGTRGREKMTCCNACRKARSRSEVKHTPWTKRAELMKMHQDHFNKVRRLMAEAQGAANHLDVLADCLEVNGGDVQSFFAEEAQRQEVAPWDDILLYDPVTGEEGPCGGPSDSDHERMGR